MSEIPPRISSEKFRELIAKGQVSVRTKHKEKSPLLALGNAAPFKLSAEQTETDDSLWTVKDGIHTTEFFIHTKTPGNSRKHWQHEARRAKRERGMVKTRLMLYSALPALPIHCTITRHSMGRIDKWNLGGTFKHIIDGIADAYRVDDRRDDLYDFQFEQAKAPRGVHKVTLAIQTKNQ